ncbi:unnamed protein product [Leuciscus chuanchicus]
MVSFTQAPTRHHEAWVVPQRKTRVRFRPRLSPTLPIFELSTQNRFSPLRETERDAVIIGDSIVRHVHATLGKSKVQSHCFPGARFSEIAARVPEILNGDERVGTVVLHAGVNDIRLRQTEILKKDFRNLIDTFEEVFLTKREQYEKLLNDGAMMFQQVPLVEIDGMQLVQSKAILNYIAGKYNLYGKDLKERALIDMYSEGTSDLMDLIMMSAFTPENKQKNISNVEQKAKERFLPVYEKGLANSHFLVGNQLSRADVHLLEASQMLQELFPTILSTFPKIQAFQEKMKALPRISKFLQPGSARKPPPDEAYVKTVKEVLSHLF